MITINNYINGEYINPKNNNWIDNYNPSTGAVFGTIANSDTDDISIAIMAAENAFEKWKNTPAENKFIILNKIAEGIENELENLAQCESMDQGKPLWLARNEMKRAAQNFRFFATAAIQFSSESHAMENKAINYTLRQPIGIVGCISPWNLPLYLFTWKIAPALACGNCVIAKPSEFTPYTAFLLGEICTKAGLPNGVLNIVHGYGNTCGQAIISNPKIKAISFTGGTATGKHIAATAAPEFKKISLELGGKNPNIIFDDCDLEKCVNTTVNSSFLNQGEICLCGSRVFIQENIYEKFKTLLVQKTKELVVGNPMDENTKTGAIVSKQHYDKILNYIEIAKQEGGKIICGGEAFFPKNFENGWYILPTIIEGLNSDCRINQEEIFGPVISLIPFENTEDVIAMANSTNYGLACTIWTQNITKAHTLAAKINCGIIWINCWLLRDLRTPFGGMNQSGVGREGGNEAMRFFTEPKNVCVMLE